MLSKAIISQNSYKPYSAEQLSHIQINSSPKFVPGSEQILYINDASGAQEMWQVSITTKPKQLTFFNQRINNLNVSQDGSFAIFAADSGGNERFDLFRYETKSDSVIRITSTPSISETDCSISPDQKYLAFEADPEIQFRPQIYLFDLQNSSRRKLTNCDKPVYLPKWAHNGKLIAATKTGDWQIGELLLINLNDSKVDSVKPLPLGLILWPISFSPDDRFVLCQTRNEDGFYDLVTVDIQTHEVKRIFTGKWDIMEADWNEKLGIIFTKNESGRVGVYRLKTINSKPDILLPPSGVISKFSISVDGSMLVFSKENSTQPMELYILDIKTKKVLQLTHSLPGEINPKLLSRALPFSIKSFDGVIIDGFFYHPFKSYKPYPSVTYIHGGPTSQSMDEFSPTIQALAQSGLAVITINYRGSSGYGKKFENLNNKDWGGGDRRDIRWVAEHFIRQGLIHPKKVGITGGSYGGYMTLISMTMDSDFYAAGAELFGMPDLIADYEITKDRFGLWYETEMGTPEKDSLLFKNRSPINYISNIKAPLFVFQGANDSNVPQKESDLIVDTLKKLGRPVEYIIYPNEGHVFTHRENIIDCTHRIVNFFKTYLIDAKP